MDAELSQTPAYHTKLATQRRVGRRSTLLALTVPLLLLPSLVGCSGGLTPKEKFWLGALIAGQTADYLTTERNLDAGAREQNSLFGSHPSDDEVLLTRAAVTGFFLLMGELDSDHRDVWYGIGGISGGAAALYNQWAYDHNRP